MLVICAYSYFYGKMCLPYYAAFGTHTATCIKVAFVSDRILSYLICITSIKLCVHHMGCINAFHKCSHIEGISSIRILYVHKYSVISMKDCFYHICSFY